MNNYEEFASFFEKAKESWAFHDVQIGQVIEELFGDKIDEEDSIFGISSSDIIKKCREILEIIMKSSKTFEECVGITRKKIPETTKVIIWLHEHQN